MTVDTDIMVMKKEQEAEQARKIMNNVTNKEDK